MRTYVIKKAYPWTDSDEIEISSDDLMFSELMNLSGIQCIGKDKDKIRMRCIKISKLIREIDELNK